MQRDLTNLDKLWDRCLEEQKAEPYTKHHAQAARDVLDLWLLKVESVTSLQRTVLDVGCGTGWLRDVFTPRGWQYTGNSLQEGADIYGDFHFLDLGQYDLVFCRHVIEHSPMPVLAVERLWSFTKPGGWCLVVTPKPPFYADWLSHFSVMPRPSWVGLFRRQGFVVENVADGKVGDETWEERFLLRRAGG